MAILRIYTVADGFRPRPYTPSMALAQRTAVCSLSTDEQMSDRDEVQVARWSAIKGRVGASLREVRLNATAHSQARLAGELEELGYHVTQSMVSRYEQGLLDAPLTLERMVGWALCCEALSSAAFKELLALAGYYLPWNEADLKAFDDLLRSYRSLSLADQVVVRGRLLWHILGIGEPI